VLLPPALVGTGGTCSSCGCTAAVPQAAGLYLLTAALSSLIAVLASALVLPSFATHELQLVLSRALAGIGASSSRYCSHLLHLEAEPGGHEGGEGEGDSAGAGRPGAAAGAAEGAQEAAGDATAAGQEGAAVDVAAPAAGAAGELRGAASSVAAELIELQEPPDEVGGALAAASKGRDG
jgi:hypothetical protein